MRYKTQMKGCKKLTTIISKLRPEEWISKSNGLNGISCLTRAAKCQTKGQHQLHVNHQGIDWPDCDQAEKSYHKPRGRKYISTTKKPISMYPNRIVGVDYPSQ